MNNYMKNFAQKIRFFEGEIAKVSSSIYKRIPKGVVASELEYKTYFEKSCKRFAITMSLIPQKKSARVLDVGISPYFLALIIKKIFKYDIIGIQSPREEWPEEKNDKPIKKDEIIKDIPEYYCNVEREKFPFGDKIFDIVICTEGIEHLIQDPLFMLKEIRRVMKKGGTMILSTPNAISLYNRIKLLSGHNVFDWYSPYGPSGRHNRQFTVSELTDLLSKANLVVDTIILANKSTENMRKDYCKYSIVNPIYNFITTIFKNLRENIFIVSHP